MTEAEAEDIIPAGSGLATAFMDAQVQAPAWCEWHGGISRGHLHESIGEDGSW